MSDFHIVIPARYGSSRLPGKPLLQIGKLPMVLHVVQRAVESGASSITVATDDERIAAAADVAGVDVCLTADDHPSGTDRLAEVAERMAWREDAVIVNLQGDEPLMPPALLQQVAANLQANPAASIATLCSVITGEQELFDPNAVKVAMDHNGFALYFSRAPIPWYRDGFSLEKRELPPMLRHYRHLGLYAYRAGFLHRYSGWQPAPVEQCESLEQLRALWMGEKIHVAEAVEFPPPGVDTQADLQRVRAILSH
ncbi:MAG: 3-deoxy-manno-octulosonate cytidylyltransferase [Pseudomonadota bacterium]